VRRRGGRAVFLGRWIGVLRALVPSLAGAAGIPYRIFLFFNVLGGITWATSFILLGYVAGSSWRKVEQAMGQATLIVVGGIVFIVILVFAARWVSSHREQIAEARDSFMDRPWIARQRDRFRRQIDFVHRRLDPRGRFGLYLTIGLVAAVVGAYIFGSILQDVLVHDELALIDRPITRWMVAHRSPWLDTTMEAVTFLASAAFAIPVAVTAAVAGWYFKRSIRWPVLFVLGVGGTELIFNLVKVLVGRPRPRIHPLIHAPGLSFPSGHTMTGVVLYGAIAYMVANGRSWKTSTWVWMAAVLISCLVGVSRIYLGAHWFTDVLGAIFLGAFWLTTSIMLTSLLEKKDTAQLDRPPVITTPSTKERAS
jgi:undecaprenyl-diphosphatase